MEVPKSLPLPVVSCRKWENGGCGGGTTQKRKRGKGRWENLHFHVRPSLLKVPRQGWLFFVKGGPFNAFACQVQCRMGLRKPRQRGRVVALSVGSRRGGLCFSQHALALQKRDRSRGLFSLKRWQVRQSRELAQSYFCETK